MTAAVPLKLFIFTSSVKVDLHSFVVEGGETGQKPKATEFLI
jgi:hypothetical protein